MRGDEVNARSLLSRSNLSAVIAGLDPAIHLVRKNDLAKKMDPRVKPAGDNRACGTPAQAACNCLLRSTASAGLAPTMNEGFFIVTVSISSCVRPNAFMYPLIWRMASTEFGNTVSPAWMPWAVGRTP